MGSGGIAVRILNLGAKWMSGQLHVSAALLLAKESPDCVRSMIGCQRTINFLVQCSLSLFSAVNL